MKGLRRINKRNKGFSMVELIVVVLIMGIVAAGIALAVMGNIEKSRKSTCIYSMNSMGREIAYNIMSEEYTTMADYVKNYSSSITVIDDNCVKCDDICQSGGVNTFKYNPDECTVSVGCSVHGTQGDITNAAPAE